MVFQFQNRIEDYFLNRPQQDWWFWMISDPGRYFPV
jgi:hypothetical protein